MQGTFAASNVALSRTVQITSALNRKLDLCGEVLFLTDVPWSHFRLNGICEVVKLAITAWAKQSLFNRVPALVMR